MALHVKPAFASDADGEMEVYKMMRMQSDAEGDLETNIAQVTARLARYKMHREETRPIRKLQAELRSIRYNRRYYEKEQQEELRILKEKVITARPIEGARDLSNLCFLLRTLEKRQTRFGTTLALFQQQEALLREQIEAQRTSQKQERSPRDPVISLLRRREQLREDLRRLRT